MTDILDLDGWTVLAKTTEEGIDILEAEYRPEPTACQKCGVIGNLYKHGTKPVTYFDAPNRGLPSKLRAKVKRYKCRDCGGTFLQPLGGIRTDRRMTERCAAFIKQQCLRDTFVRIADNIGCDDKTVRSLAGDHIAAIAAAGNRCQSCGGVFEPAELQIHQTLPLVAGEHRKVMVVCRPCHERFHTSALTHTHGRSTS